MNSIFDFKENDRRNCLEMTVSASIKELRFSAHYKGYRFLRVALIHTIKDPTLIDDMAGRLYVAVAQECEADPSSVPRAIHTAIGNAWAEVSPEVAQKYFGYYDPDDIPCNKKFIATVADYIRLRTK